MFSKLFGGGKPSPPRSVAGRQCFDLICAAREYFSIEKGWPLPASLAKDPIFIGRLMAMMDMLSEKSGESNFLKPNCRGLFSVIFGEPNAEHAAQLMARGDSNPQLMQALVALEQELPGNSNAKFVMLSRIGSPMVDAFKKK